MSQQMLQLGLNATGETLYMVLISSAIATLIGIPLGVLLQVTHPGSIVPNSYLYKTLAAIVNATRSIPFIILLVAVIPFTRLIVGTSIGTTAAIVPLTIGAIPFIARLVENSLAEVDAGLIEAGLAMGCTPLQLIRKILLPEAMSSIINGITLTCVALIGYSAMAGAVGGGGLGDLAIQYGYQRFNASVMLATVVILIMMVQLIQIGGDWLVKAIKK